MLFYSMTGIEGRPEVILEGAHNLDGPWEEYEFFYKPGALDRKPVFLSIVVEIYIALCVLCAAF